jgi:hypothetical protein
MPTLKTFPNTQEDSTPYQLVFTDAGEVSMVIRAGAVIMTQLLVTNLSATAGFVQVFDASSLPGNGAAPLFTLPLPASGAVSLDTPVCGAAGLVVAISTTAETLTISTDEAKFLANVK